MPRPVTLFTGQWADLSFEQICADARGFGYDGLELACWGDHFDVSACLADPDYAAGRWRTLSAHGLKSWAVSSHLVGQAVCDLIDARHQSILPPDVWGDGNAEGVRRRAAQRMIDTARACRKFIDAGTKNQPLPAVVNGFSGSSVWHSVYPFPPTDQQFWQRGFDDFAARWGPILDEFDRHNVNFALEVHPTEIAFDIASAQRAVDAVKGHKRFGFNYDPSHLAYQGVDYVRFLYTFGDRIFHVHMKDVSWGHGDGTVGVFGGHASFGDPRRFWDFRSLGRGNVDFERIIAALNDIRYGGPLSVEWEDSRMDRRHGAAESAAFVRRLDFPPSGIAFDAQFQR
jgi:sugar phosphate isomerase/epimerase